MKQPADAGRLQGNRDIRGRFIPGASGNPAGKAPGVRNRATVMAQHLLNDAAGEVIARVIQAALAGDPTGMRLVTERLLPPKRELPISNLV